MYTIKIGGAASAVNGATRVVNTLTPVVRETATTYRTPSVPPEDAHARTIAEQAGRWITFACERSRMAPRTVTAKALAAVAFSVQHQARSLAVPSKLAGVRGHQRRLWEIVRSGYRAYETLGVDLVSTDGITLTYDGDPVGAVQTKHVPWARPLVPFGLTVHLARVTGSDQEGYMLGVNVVFGGVGEALGKILDALGTNGDGLAAGGGRPGGPGPSVEVSVPLRLVEPGPAHPADTVPVHPGDTIPEALDVVLYRTVDGHACATLEHVVRHSPTGIEWGYAGSGPADLALSVLARVAGMDEAEAHYQHFKAEVVARLPYAGGVVRAEDVRRWLIRQEAPPRPAA